MILFNERIANFGQVTDLSADFDVKDKDGNRRLFTIYLRPISTTEDYDTVVSCIGNQMSEPADLPIRLNEWSPALLKVLCKESIDLEQYDVYWGVGNY